MEAGADVRQPSRLRLEHPHALLSAAAHDKDTPQVVHLLPKAGANINRLDSDGGVRRSIASGQARRPQPSSPTEKGSSRRFISLQRGGELEHEARSRWKTRCNAPGGQGRGPDFDNLRGIATDRVVDSRSLLSRIAGWRFQDGGTRRRPLHRVQVLAHDPIATPTCRVEHGAITFADANCIIDSCGCVVLVALCSTGHPALHRLSRANYKR